MIRLAILTALIAALAFLAQLALDVEQTLVFSVYGYDIETTTTVLLAALLLSLGVFFTLGQLLSVLRGAPKRLLAWRKRKQDAESLSLFLQGLSSLSVGDFDRGRKLAQKLRGLTSDVRLPLYLESAATLQSGDSVEKPLLALEAHNETALMAQLGLLSVYRRKNAYEALKLKAQQTLKGYPSNIVALSALWDALIALKQYDEALAIVPRMRRYGVKGAEEMDLWVASLYTIQAKGLEAKAREKLLKKALAVRASFIPAILELAEYRDGKAKERLLHDFLLKTFHEDVFTAWLKCLTKRSVKSWSKAFEKLLAAHEDDAFVSAYLSASCLEHQGNRTKALAELVDFCHVQPNRQMFLWSARLEDMIAGKVGAGYDFLNQALNAEPFVFSADEDVAFYASVIAEKQAPLELTHDAS